MTSLNMLQSGDVLKRTTSRCPMCLGSVEAIVERRGESVWLTRTCATHGTFTAQIAADARFYHVSQGAREDDGCGGGGGCGCAPPARDGADAQRSGDPFETLSTCIALIEIVDTCNLKCPTCYAASPFGIDEDIECVPPEQFIERVQGVIDRKGKEIDILQLSGGEPTIHPQLFEILDWSLANPDIGYVLLNTNGVRIARDRAFRERLAESRTRHGGFELYLQFDGPQQEGQLELRGADLREVRRECIDSCGELGVPTTLAMVVTPTTIAHLGDTLRFGLERPHVRGISFQPMFTSGRVPSIESSNAMLAAAAVVPRVISVGDVINALVEQSGGVLSLDDFTPLPCGDPNCHTIGYLIRTEGGPIGLGSLVDLKSLQGFLRDRVDYRVEDLAKCGCDNQPLGRLLKEFEIGPDQPFRLFIKPFMDAWSFDQDRIDRCCTHVIRPDGRLDSFCRYYLEQASAR